MKRVLLVNRRDRPFELTIPGASGGQMEYVDQTTGFQPPATTRLGADLTKLNGYCVAVVTFP